MRQVKFRVWDKKAKVMRMAEEIGFVSTHDEYGDEGGLPYSVNVFDGEYFSDLPPDMFILMQFTGIKDKNGNDIFGGDIVKMVLDKVIPRYAICEVKWRDEYAGFNFSHVRLENIMNPGEGWSMSTHDNWEVIGNVYENAELLDGK